MYPSALMLLLLVASPLFEMTQAEIDQYLRKIDQSGGSFAQRVHRAALKGLGTPYQDGPLGEGPQGKYDTDPQIDFTKADCVTYVEQTLALAGAVSYDEMFKDLQSIRYRKGIISYEDRNHFMISDWIGNNPFCKDISADLGVRTKALTRTISRKDFFQKVNAPTLGQTTPDQDITIQVIPSSAAAQAQKSLPDQALIIFIGKTDWLFALHCGLYLRNKDGNAKLYHASSKAQEVVAIDLPTYLNQQATRYIGFTAYSMTEGAP